MGINSSSYHGLHWVCQVSYFFCQYQQTIFARFIASKCCTVPGTRTRPPETRNRKLPAGNAGRRWEPGRPPTAGPPAGPPARPPAAGPSAGRRDRPPGLGLLLQPPLPLPDTMCADNKSSGSKEQTTRVYIYSFYFSRESDIQHVDTERVFHTPGIFYRPDCLKTMTALMGNTETRSVYNNFHLENLNSNDFDYSHQLYQCYLQYKKFIPPGETNYWVHTMNNILPAPPSTTAGGRGLFNLFPLDLASEELKTPPTTLGVVSTSPLKIELEFSPILPATFNWFLMFTFVYANKINFTGSKTKQDVTYDYINN